MCKVQLKAGYANLWNTPPVSVENLQPYSSYFLEKVGFILCFSSLKHSKSSKTVKVTIKSHLTKGNKINLTHKYTTMNTVMSKRESDGKYNIQSLIDLNPYANTEHRITQADADMANTYVSLIEQTRSDIIPKAGDILRYTDKHGNYSPYAHIEYNHNGICNICEHPYVPFINSDKDGISCNTSGGAWDNVNASELRYIGKEQKHFKDWGHWGACANGSIQFTAEVSVWEYVHPEPLYRDYTTEKWRKLYISRISEEKRKNYGGYLYSSDDGVAFHTDSELNKFLREYKGEIFNGHWDNQLVIWCYKEQQTVMSQEEFDALNLPVTTIYCNGKQPAKIMYDDENRTAILYFVMPDRCHC